MVKKKRLLAGIDVGTTKICTVIAEVNDQQIEIRGSGLSPSRGLRKGVIVNLTETIESIKDSLEKAEEEAQSVVEAAFVSVGGGFVRGYNSRGRTEVRSKAGEVCPDDIGRAVADARNLEIPENFEVIHVLTQAFNLDGHDGIVNPLGMTGKHLTVNLHLILNASAVVQNIVNAINKSGVVVHGVVLQQLASAESVLTADEKEMGAVLVDVGGGTTDIAVYQNGSIWHSEVLPIGGSLITKDIAIGLKAPLEEAEQLKKGAGNVFPEEVSEEEVIEVDEVGSRRRRTYSRRLLCQIIQARCDEILEAVARVKRDLGIRSDLITGMVFTGGGSLLDGMIERAEATLDLPVRLGYPVNVARPSQEIFHPGYSTALGLLKYSREINGEQVGKVLAAALAGRPRWSTERVKNWIFERIG